MSSRIKGMISIFDSANRERYRYLREGDIVHYMTMEDYLDALKIRYGVASPVKAQVMHKPNRGSFLVRLLEDYKGRKIYHSAGRDMLASPAELFWDGKTEINEELRSALKGN